MIVTLKAFHRRASKMAERTLKTEGHVTMFWLIDTPTGQQTLHIPMESQEQGYRDAVAQIIREHLAKYEAFRYAMVAEVWMSIIDNDCPPEEDPERKEFVMIIAEDSREQLTAMREIVRPPHHKPLLGKVASFAGANGEVVAGYSKFDKTKPNDDVKIDGRFVNLLPTVNLN
jgi:hypothetical protein